MLSFARGISLELKCRLLALNSRSLCNETLARNSWGRSIFADKDAWHIPPADTLCV